MYQYELEEPRLGVGGFGEVWKARREDNGEFVAIKVFVQRKGSQEIIAQEIRALESQAQNPFVVRLKDTNPQIMNPQGYWTSPFERQPPPLCFAMELCQGQSLDAYVPNKLPVAEVGRIIQCVVVGLAEIHQTGWVHRDIKPDNLLHLEHGCLKICDFGSASPFESENPFPVANKDGYQAPEAKQTKPHPSHDIFSLGQVLLALLPPTTDPGAELLQLGSLMASGSPGDRPTASNCLERLQKILG